MLPFPPDQIPRSGPPPEWAQAFIEAICRCFNELDGTKVGFDFRYAGPEQQLHDEYLFLFAPKPLQISGGEVDGQVVCEQLSVDIQGVQRLFTNVDTTEYSAKRGVDLLHRRHVEIAGKLGERSVTVYIFDEPFEGATPETLQDDDNQFLNFSPPKLPPSSTP